MLTRILTTFKLYFSEVSTYCYRIVEFKLISRIFKRIQNLKTIKPALGRFRPTTLVHRIWRPPAPYQGNRPWWARLWPSQPSLPNKWVAAALSPALCFRSPRGTGFGSTWSRWNVEHGGGVLENRHSPERCWRRRWRISGGLAMSGAWTRGQGTHWVDQGATRGHPTTPQRQSGAGVG
jgi:hypothetical protein